jgi:Rhodopirellula transposase DDE domain
VAHHRGQDRTSRPPTGRSPPPTSTGLEVYARLDQNDYPKIEVTDTELAAVNLTRDTFHGEWNYSINPSNN